MPSHPDMKSSKRYHGLDLVRAVAMLLGLVMHVSMFYRESSWGWIAGSRMTDSLNLLATEAIHFFRMQLFFLLAGFFAQLVIERRGMHVFLRDRFKRIVLPLLVGVLFLLPVLNLFFCWLGMLNPLLPEIQRGNYLDSFLALATYGLTGRPYPFPEIFLWHFWFLYDLVLCYLIHWLCFYALGSTRVAVFCGGLLGTILSSRWAALILGLLCVPVHFSLKQVGVDATMVNPEINVLLYYLFYYLVGVGIYRQRHHIETIQRWWMPNIVLALCMVPFLNGLTVWVSEMTPSVVSDLQRWQVVGFHWVGEAFWEGGLFKLVVATLRSCGTWMLCLGFIGLAERVFRKENPIVRYISDSSYWIYYAHLPVSFGLAMCCMRLEVLNSATKAYICVVLSLYLLWGSYNLMVRYSFLGDFFMGRRKQRNSSQSIEHLSTAWLIGRTWRPVLVGLLLVHSIGMALSYQGRMEGRHILSEAKIAQEPGFYAKHSDVSQYVNSYGKTALHLAVATDPKVRAYDIIQVLLDHFSNVDPRDKMGRTPLFIAVRGGKVDDARQLLMAGADPNLADHHGHTAAHVAAIKATLPDAIMSATFSEILELLQQYGANLEIKDQKGRSVRDWLASNP